MDKKRNGRNPGEPGRNGKQRGKKCGFSQPHRQKDRRRSAHPWKLDGLLPPLPPEEFNELKESIRHDGVLVPSIVDAEGNIIDGDHREAACKELGIFCPREVREFASDAEKLQLAIRLNISRRHLTRAQKRELITTYLKVDPAINDRHLGDVCKTSKNTVADERRRLERTGQIDQLDKRLGRDGKMRPAKHRRIIANTPKEHEKAQEAIRKPPPHRIL